MSTKKVWRLKKYAKSELEIQQEQSRLEDLEFSTKPKNIHSIKRPNNQRKKPGETQEFVFVDLSPKKKSNSNPLSPPNSEEPQISNELKQQKPRLDPSTLKTFEIDEKIINQKQSRVSKLFRLPSSSSSSNNNDTNLKNQQKLKPSPLQLDNLMKTNSSSKLLASPTIIPDQSSALSSSSSTFSSNSTKSSISSTSSINISTSNNCTIPPLKRSFTTIIEGSTRQQREQSPTTFVSSNGRERSNSSASLVMTVSDSGRAILRPTGDLSPSPSLSQNELHSLSRSNSRISTIPSPNRIQSPINTNNNIITQQRAPNLHRSNTVNDIPKFPINNETELVSSHSDNDFSDEDEDDCDAFKAFSKVVKRNFQRKRANTAGSIGSISSIGSLSNYTNNNNNNNNSNNNNNNVVRPTGLVRQQSLTSVPPSYNKFGRVSPSRLRQTASISTSDLQNTSYSNEFNFFDDYSRQSDSRRAHSKQLSISHQDHHPSNDTQGKHSNNSQSKPISSLGPPLDIDRFGNHTEYPLQSPASFSNKDNALNIHSESNTNNNEFDFPSVDMKFNISFPVDQINTHDDYFDFNAFINYDDTLNNSVN